MTFEEFATARLGSLVRYATVLTWDPYLAEDITQEVLLKAQTRWGRIGGLDAPEQYVKRMILNQFLSWRRRRAARMLTISPEALESIAPPVADSAAAAEDRDLVLRLIATLPPRQRAALALRYYEDMSDDQIAELLGCRPVTVRTQIFRALATLRAALPVRPSVIEGVPS
ncbi:SigE family RNA polymerase sigma factor [Phytohabitans flavus]|uniref:RNA polymerase sigma24 factor n=1 Tax=Phytohabitans flavus TaxID=1076124 RepID=A0A6F8XV52_9ACTN|nr:SigE family RNA polymerase sigma factor [Phytohabitans flavus]BCB77667.1 RNA polymerase sigma24 factor [Phytohabitans flavus]